MNYEVEKFSDGSAMIFFKSKMFGTIPYLPLKNQREIAELIDKLAGCLEPVDVPEAFKAIDNE